MALFKIEKGLAADLATNRRTTNEGWCYFTTDDGKFYIDIETGSDLTKRVCLNAQKADYAEKANLATYSMIQEGMIMHSQIASFPGAFYPSILRPRHDEDFTYYGSSIKIFMLNAEIQGTLYNSINTTIELDCSTFTLNQIATINEEQSDNILYKKFIRSARIDPNTLELIDTEWSEWKPYGLQQDNSDYLPLTAGEENKISGPLGFETVMYGSELPDSGFEGQLFFLADEDSGTYLPAGGVAGQALIKHTSEDGDATWEDIIQLPSGGTVGQTLVKTSNEDGAAIWKDVVALPKGGNAGQALIKVSSTDGDAEWKEIVALPKGGAQGQILTKNSSTDGDAAWQNFPELNYLPLNGGYMNGRLGGARGHYTNDNVSELWNHGGIEIRENDAVGNTKESIGYAPTLGFHWSGKTASALSLGADGILYLYNNVGSLGQFKAGAVYGAVWNDYAEYRSQKEEIEPGYCVASSNNGQVYKTTEKFQACDGIVSDTFGFAIGETDECKTPLAVAGRVLAYCEGDKYDYHSGDTVCAGPEGKVCKMTREEIREWPDRIIGIVSEIPEYETWGTGNINVNGRIWIKIK